MDFKKIIPVIIIALVIIIGAAYLATSHNPKNMTQTNNTTNSTNITNATNITGNITGNTLNKTAESTDSSSSNSQKSESDPAYGSDEYVEKWDKSQASNDNWAYTHDQPVKTGDDGQQYARVYDEASGESSWRSMAPAEDENSE